MYQYEYISIAVYVQKYEDIYIYQYEYIYIAVYVQKYEDIYISV
jgi:hypothetical protein